MEPHAVVVVAVLPRIKVNGDSIRRPGSYQTLLPAPYLQDDTAHQSQQPMGPFLGYKLHTLSPQNKVNLSLACGCFSINHVLAKHLIYSGRSGAVLTLKQSVEGPSICRRCEVQDMLMTCTRCE